MSDDHHTASGEPCEQTVDLEAITLAELAESARKIAAAAVDRVVLSGPDLLPDPYPSHSSGRITARLLGGGTVELRRYGGPGAGPSLSQLLLGRDQVETTLAFCAQRRDADGRDQAAVLRWALRVMADG